MTARRIKTFLTGIAVAAALAVPTAASAQDYVNNETPEVKGITDTRTDVAPATESRGDSLPITGGDVAGLTAIGIAAVGAGAVLVRRSRRATA